MLKIAKVLLVVACCLYATASFSQETEEMLQARLKEKVHLLNDYIELMADTKNVTTRRYYMEQALDLFVGRGYEYEMDGIKHDGASIEIISPMGRKQRRKLIRDYLKGVIYMSYSPNIAIETVTYVYPNVSSLMAIDDSTYLCTCELRKFPASNNTSKSVCTIRTAKRIKVIIKKEDIVRIEDGSIEMPILLCDILAITKNNK